MIKKRRKIKSTLYIITNSAEKEQNFGLRTWGFLKKDKAIE
jgi:hypothetical protein